MKKYITLALLVVVMIVAGLAVQYFCFRFPTEAELRRFHEAKQTTSVESLEVIDKPKPREGESLVDEVEYKYFRVTHSNNSGYKEAYNLATPKRWVMPWNDYQWMLKK